MGGDKGELKLHSWVIVAQGDVAVTGFVEDGGYDATTAGPIAKEVLEAPHHRRLRDGAGSRFSPRRR